MKKITFLLFVTAIIMSGCTYPNSYNTNYNDPDRVACRQGGGKWIEFSNSCHDTCYSARNETGCFQAFSEGCSCGENKCWNRETKKCELN